MANRRYFQFNYSLHPMPVSIDCNFVVDSTNGNGLGIRSLKGPGVKSVFMHTSATPAGGNPNPASGYIWVQLSDNYNRYFGGESGFVAPLSGSNLAVNASALTVGNAYVITAVGTSTAADWLALGVPAGVTAAPGVAFIALVTGTGSGSGFVQAPKTGASGIDHIEVVGDPNTTIAPQPAVSQGMWILLECLFEGALTAPANGTVIGLQFNLSNSSVTVAGE